MIITTRETATDVIVEDDGRTLRNFDAYETPRAQARIAAEAYADGVRQGLALADTSTR